MWKLFRKKETAVDETHRTLQLITQKGMPFGYVEAYKSLRTNINFLTSSQGARSFVVTSTVPEEAKSNVSVNLALTLAASGKSVVLVDCDLRKPILHRYLKTGHNTKGVANVLSNTCTLEEAIVHLQKDDVYFLPAGTPPPNPSELLGQPQMQSLIDRLRATFDYVILDAPPIQVVTDAAVIGRMVDGVLFVVRSQYSPLETTKSAVKKLQDAGVKIVGVVLTRYDVKKSLKSSSYAYSYSYAYGYGNATASQDSDEKATQHHHHHAEKQEVAK